MKTLILILFFFCSIINAQQLNEKQSIEKTHIDFSKEYIYFTIHGQIVIDCYSFYNDTCKCPIIYMANLDGVTIMNKCTGQKYIHVICNDCKNANVIKLEEIKPKYKNNDFSLPIHEFRYNKSVPYIFNENLKEIDDFIIYGDTLK